MLRLRLEGYPGRNPWLKQSLNTFSQDETLPGAAHKMADSDARTFVSICGNRPHTHFKRMQKEPLFRKENRTARGMRHSGGGGEFRHKRNTKKEVQSEATRTSMNGKRQRGLDYTPLFMFLLSKVSTDWNSVYGEAVNRLDKPEPIFWLVALHEHEKKDLVRVGEASYFSGLYVNEQGLLVVVNPNLGPERMAPLCRCCTYTFNGTPFGRPATEASISSGNPLSE